ncbi:hypothetical protein K435DRAFT_706204, partial [Dendrothele bispora CBS 962.96]
FGIGKRRFKILNIAPEYPFKSQMKIPPALSALHNFIHIKDPSDEAEGLNLVSVSRNQTREGQEFGFDIDEEEIGESQLGGKITSAEKGRANSRRDRIAEEMWQDYQNYLQTQS